MKRICIQCGSSPGFDPVYVEMARRLGGLLATRGIEVIYGGADVGLMGAVANAALKAGGVVRGIIPSDLAEKVRHDGLTELRVVDSMHERKKLMFDLSDGFIAMPGGYGTLEEIAEVLTWAQLCHHSKPCALLNVAGYYDPLLAFFESAATRGFLKLQDLRLLLVSAEPEDLLAKMEAYCPAIVPKWIGLHRGETP